MKALYKQSLAYHRQPPPGKIAISLTKPLASIKDLSLAYTPGVAQPCREIAINPKNAYQYTNKGNLVAVISNGTAVLGLGDIGALAGKPVMEGKAALFKHFADINAVDIEIDEKNPDKLAEIIKAISPSFGAINLEDIKAPGCFIVEAKLQSLGIPVFHDDQHGTAIVVAAALKNSLEIVGKKINQIKLIISGSGAAATAVANFLLTLGVVKNNLYVYDSQGLLVASRKDLNQFKKPLARPGQPISFEKVFSGADVFIGLSRPNLVTKTMIKSMAKKPIVFALANPDPEISYETVKSAVPDAIVATGRSDYPNQINNALCFPFIFKGALLAKAKQITLKMELAAVETLANLAKTAVPQAVEKLYKTKLSFGPDYILPKLFDPRLEFVSQAVNRAAGKLGKLGNGSH